MNIYNIKAAEIRLVRAIPQKWKYMTVEDNPKQTYVPHPWLRRLARTSAWLLLAGVVVLVVSGWGITQTGAIYKISFGLIDRRLADTIHREANLPLAVFFLVHVMVNLKISIARNHPSRAWLINSILIIAGLSLLAIAVYMDYFRSGG